MSTAWTRCAPKWNPFSTTNLRGKHHAVATLLGGTLAFQALCGTLYRIGRNWLGYEKEQVIWLRELHTGKSFYFQAYYPFLIGLTIFFMAFSGFLMSKQSKWLSELLWKTKTAEETVAEPQHKV